MLKILILGSKGFIESHCVNYFAQNNNVLECDIIPDYNNNKYVKIDASNSDFNKLFLNQSFDICINCSGAANVADSYIHPLSDYLLNTCNVAKILDAIRLHNSNCKFVNLSSAAVYGNPLSLPVHENIALQPLSNYGYHKKYAEEICNQYWNIYGIKSTTLRIFSAYGIGLKKQIFWDTFKKTSNSTEITLFGTGNETRDYIYIDDLMKSIALIIENEAFEGSVYNVSSGIQTTIKEATMILLKNLDWKGELNFNRENRIGDPIHWHADITKLKKLGFSPSFTMNQGLKEVAEWMKKTEKIKNV